MQLETDAVLGSTTLNAMYAYWIRIKGGNEIPLRRDLDPTEIGPVLLPYSLLADVDTRTQSVRHRVVGTNFTDFFGRDITGMELSTVLEGNYLEFIRGLYMLACEQRVAVVSHSRFRWDQGRLVKASRLMMPLSKDGSRSDMCYTCQVFETGEGPMPPQVFIASGGATPDGSPAHSTWEDVSQKFSHLSADVI